MRVRCRGENTWTDVNADSENWKCKTKRGWNIVGDERPTPTGMSPIQKNMIHMHMNV